MYGIRNYHWEKAGKDYIFLLVCFVMCSEHGVFKYNYWYF